MTPPFGPSDLFHLFTYNRMVRVKIFCGALVEVQASAFTAQQQVLVETRPAQFLSDTCVFACLPPSQVLPAIHDPTKQKCCTDQRYA